MELKNKEILVTGGTGFIGSTIVNLLANQGQNVNILDFNKNFLWRIENPNKCKFYKVDLRNIQEVKQCIHNIKPNVVFHLAAYVNHEEDFNSIEKLYSINFNGTKNLIMALNDYEYDLFINTGTCEEYGKNEVPFKESYRENPTSPYSSSKVASTYFCEMISSIFDKPIITIRPSLVYGPKQISKSLIPSLIFSGFTKASLSLTPCEQTRDFIYVKDLAEAYVSLAINADKVKKMGIFNIGSGIETPIKDIVSLSSNYFEDPQFIIGDKDYRSGEIMRYYCSIEKIKKSIRWTTKWKLDVGINNTINWWQNNREIWIKYKNIWI